MDQDGNAFFDDEEKKHFRQVMQTFQNYEKYMKIRVNGLLGNYEALSRRHKEMLFDFEENCTELLKCASVNTGVIKLILKFIENMFVNQEYTAAGDSSECAFGETFDMDRVLTTLKQIARDWSEYGADERKACYEPIVSDVLKLFPEDEFDRSTVSVLVPGAGLGRLAFEIANVGFKCEGNEFSLFMLMASNFILNKCDQENQFEIYPWIHQTSNNMNFKDQTCRVRFPDVAPLNAVSSQSQFSMAAGDFLEIYNEPESWHVIVTCYFIDTAHNVLDYIDKIHYLLAHGGYWINFGPLMYHFADTKNEKSIELSYEQIKRAISKTGFVFKSEQTRVKSTYTENKNSMYRYMYDCVYFICQKP